MTPGHQRKLGSIFRSEVFKSGSVQEAVEAIRTVMPGYDLKQEQAVAIGLDGMRWFECHEAAIADALHRHASKPYDPAELMDGKRWRTECNEDGMWAIVNLGHNHRY